MPFGRKLPRCFRPLSHARRAENREALIGILFVLYTAIPWERLPFEVAGCSGMTCWRRLRAWQDAGLWDEIHRHMLERLNLAGDRLVARQRGRLFGARQKGGDAIGPNPTDRGKPGTKRHIVVDAIHPVRQRRGRPRRRLDKLHADKGYDFDRCRRDLRRRAITPHIARRGIDSSEHLGKHRWVVERTFAWINQFRRLAIRYERHADRYRAFCILAAAIICFRAISRFC
jgi:transposase